MTVALAEEKVDDGGREYKVPSYGGEVDSGATQATLRCVLLAELARLFRSATDSFLFDLKKGWIAGFLFVCCECLHLDQSLLMPPSMATALANVQGNIAIFFSNHSNLSPANSGLTGDGGGTQPKKNLSVSPRFRQLHF